LIGGGGSKISNFCLSAAAATKLSGFRGGGSKISIFFCLSAAAAEKFSICFCCRRRRLKFFDDFSKICLVSRNFGIIKRKIIIENVVIRN
jgi:hypothetical protein